MSKGAIRLTCGNVIYFIEANSFINEESDAIRSKMYAAFHRSRLKDRLHKYPNIWSPFFQEAVLKYSYVKG